jgi:Flp pilus assembly protein TadG
MKHPTPRSVQRSGVAAAELVATLPFLLILLFGIWDVGRTVEVQQLVSNAAREGARLAAIGTMLDPTTGYERDIDARDVQNTVTNYLTRNGLTTMGITVQYSNLTNPAATDPYLAQHLDHLRVQVQLPFQNVRLILVNGFSNNQTTALTATADWMSMRDSNVNVSTTLPTN